MKISPASRRPSARPALFAAALVAMGFGAGRPHPRGMALNVINVGRNNQRYPIKDLFVVNSGTTTQPQGAIVILSWTPDGTVHATIAGSSIDIVNSHQKAVVLDTAGIAASATGRVRVQGPVLALMAANGTYSAEDPVIVTGTGVLGTTLTLAKGAVVKVTSTDNTSTGAVGFVHTTLGSSSSVALGSIIFDGTDVNTVRYV